MRTVTIYRDDSTSQVVYENVKHAFMTCNNTVLTLAIQPDPKDPWHYYVNWNREKYVWYKEEPTK